MNRMIALAAATVLSLGVASVAMATPQQERMKACNVEAKGKTGDARKAFMKECLSADKPAAKGASSTECEKKAVSKDGKPLAGAAKSSFMKKCVADAAK